MGTFHHDRSELHGITVVVETSADEIYVGRCDDMDEERVILLDADRFEAGGDGDSRAAYLEKAARFGVWKKFDRLVVPRSAVTAVRRLGDLG